MSWRQNYKETHVSVKKLIYKDFLLKWKLLKYLGKRKKIGKHIQDAERLAEELQQYPCLHAWNEKGNKGYKERKRKENAWKAVEQFLTVF